MTPARILLAGASLSLLACGVPAREAGAAAPRVGTTAGDAPDGAALKIALRDGRSVALRGFKVDAKHGLSDVQCGVMLGGQRLLTLGVDETDAYTCDGLAAAGALSPAGKAQRIGLIYDVSSPNAHFRTAVVLRESGGRWHVDAALAGRFDDTAAGKSIPALRRALR